MPPFMIYSTISINFCTRTVSRIIKLNLQLGEALCLTNPDLLLNFIFKLYHKTCEHFYRNFGLYEKSPNSFLPGLPRSIVNQFRFHNLLCLCLASVHLPHPLHLIFGFQLFGHAVSLRQLRHDQLHAVSCRFVNLSAILSYVHPAMQGQYLFRGRVKKTSEKREKCGPERCAPGHHIASKPVSRVLSFKTAIYLDVPLPVRSSRLLGTAGPASCPSTALLRIEFTAMDAWHAIG